MTKEEYDEIVSNVDSEDPAERVQALFVLGLFPKWGGGETYTMDEVENKLKSILGEYRVD